MVEHISKGFRLKQLGNRLIYRDINGYNCWIKDIKIFVGYNPGYSWIKRNICKGYLFVDIV
jgi:hypothetical protein